MAGTYKEPSKEIKRPEAASQGAEKAHNIRAQQEKRLCEQEYGGMYDFASGTCKNKTKTGL